MIRLFTKVQFSRPQNFIPGTVDLPLEFEFDFFTSFEVDQSVDNLANTATVSFPKKLKFVYNGVEVQDIVTGKNPLFTRGTSIKIYCGYDDLVPLIFEGYIDTISPRMPIVLTCQDEMWHLKQILVEKKYFKKKTLKEILDDLIPNTPKSVADITIGDLKISRANVANVLEHLKSNFGISSFFRDGILYSGLRFITEDLSKMKTWEFERETNIVDDNDLIYQRSDDVVVQLRAININDKNEKNEYIIGPGYAYSIDKDKNKVGIVKESSGDVRTMYFYNSNASTLKTLAEESYKKIIYEGFSGSFTSFIAPNVEAGDAVRLINGRVPELNGTYLVSRVVSTGSVDNGGKQRIFLDRKIGDGVKVVGDNVIDKNEVYRQR